ncbi:uncharacterized protein [Asterias amurensis]|uniref:uncharacterized protein n=1 Tax=Asterias amurensis TaxID=7602 RepID=UPI003AB3AB43
MSVATFMMPNDRQILPAISQHRSISLRDNSTSGRGYSTNRKGGGNSIAAAVQRPSGGESVLSVPRTESSGQSSTISDSSVPESPQTRSRRSSSQFSSITRTDTGLQPRHSLALLPRLIDDQSFIRAARNTSSEHSALSSRSLEILPSRDFISDELRMRTVSLPILGHRHKHRPRILHDTEEEEGEYLTDSYSSDTDDPSGDESNIVEIGPYPNVGVDSYLDSHLLPEFLPAYLKPWTPGIRKSKPKRNRNNAEAEKKRKELEALQAKTRKRNSQSKSNPRRRSVRSNAFTRKREQEVAKRHPVRKQFVYSELVQDEFQKHIPQRLPGGKLKPIYNRRTTEGEIYVPENLDISFERLTVKPGDERLNSWDTPAAINRRRKEEFQALLEKRKKLQRQMVSKKKRKVRFVLPEEKGEIEVGKVSIEGAVRPGSGSISQQSIDGSELEEGDTTTEHGELTEGEQGVAASASEHPSNLSLNEVVDSEILYDGNEERIQRTNSWVTAQSADLSPETESGTETDANHNSLQIQGDIERANSSSNAPEDISNETSPENSTSKTDTNSTTGDIVGPPGGSVSQADTLPGSQSNPGSYSLLRTVELPPRESIETTRDIKILFERIPSIIISDT